MSNPNHNPIKRKRDETATRARALHQAGLSDTEIGRLWGITRQVVWRLRRYGVVSGRNCGK